MKKKFREKQNASTATPAGLAGRERAVSVKCWWRAEEDRLLLLSLSVLKSLLVPNLLLPKTGKMTLQQRTSSLTNKTTILHW